MKLFKTGSAAVVVECQKQFSFLPLKYQVDIRTARFMLRFMATENSICKLFILQATSILAKLNDRYGVSDNNMNSLIAAASRQFYDI